MLLLNVLINVMLHDSSFTTVRQFLRQCRCRDMSAEIVNTALQKGNFSYFEKTAVTA